MDATMLADSAQIEPNYPETNAIEPYYEERPEAEEAPMAPEWPPYCNPAYIMPATIQVAVVDVDGNRHRMPIAVQKASKDSKPYLGGYRNKKTGLKYHHASTNTASKIERKDIWKNPKNKSHRETQTYVMKTRSVMTGRECGTQMERKDILIDDSADKIIVSKPYFTSVELGALKERNVLVIQCYWRGYVARKRCWEIREDQYNAYVSFREKQEKALVEAETKRQSDIERRMHPKTAKDFELLYGELESWVQSQIKDMNQRLSMGDIDDKDKRRMMADILAKQTKALQTIDKLKNEAAAVGREKRTLKMQEVMAQPKLWELSNGEVQEVHTQFTIRAAELMDLYHGLIDMTMTVDERLDILLNVKWTVREFDCTLTRDIVDLCDREAETLNRGRPVETLQGLRKRLSNLFLQFIESPDFNPEASRFLKVKPTVSNQTAVSQTVRGSNVDKERQLMSVTA